MIQRDATVMLAAALLALSLMVSCTTSRLDPCGSEGCLDAAGDAGDGGGLPDVALDSAFLFPDRRLPDHGPTCPPNSTVCGNNCCNKDQLCIKGTCMNLGPKCDELWPCPKGYYCDESKGRCMPGATKCEYKPAPGDFKPKVKWEWTGSTVETAHNQVMMAPVVANLSDDNKDGKIDRDDVPDIVFHTYTGSNYGSDGVMRVISGDGKGEHFSVTAAAHRTHPGTQIALGDIDGDGIVEIVACASGGGVIAFEHDGKLKWKTSAACYAPALADLDADGKPEVVVNYTVLRGATGKVWWKGTTSGGTMPKVADIDEDGKPEVVGGNVVYRHDGKIYWHHSTRPDGTVAVADLDGSGKPEIITVSTSDHSLRAYHHDGTKYWGPVDINQGHATSPDKCNGCGGGPPTVADFDGDGKPEIAAAAGWGYVVFEHDGKPKWFQPTKDLSSRATGSSVFDFEGDGKAEVVYSDEHLLRIYQGSTGKVLFSHCNTSGTLREYPLVVDVDNDGHAEIVVANNNYAFKTCPDMSPSHTGIKVLSDTKLNWVKTRRIWNQHTYHITNVDEDGRIPKVEARNWDNPNLNNFRQNVQPGGLFDAPDLTGAAGKPSCTNTISVVIEVNNQGAAKVSPGIDVTLYVNDPAKGPLPLQTVQTKTTIYAGQSEKVSFSVKTPKQYQKQIIDLFAVVDDDGKGTGKANECKEGNNKVQAGKVACPIVG